MKSKLFFEPLGDNQYNSLVTKIPAIGKIITGYCIVRKNIEEMNIKRDQILDFKEEMADADDKSSLKAAIVKLADEINTLAQKFTIKPAKFRVIDFELHSVIREPKKKVGVTISKGKYKYLILCEKI